MRRAIGRALGAIVILVTVASCTVTWISTGGKRFTDDDAAHVDAARAALIESAAHDIPCAADQVKVVLGGRMGHNSLVTGCGKMCGYQYTAYGVTSAGWRLTSCTALTASLPLKD